MNQDQTFQVGIAGGQKLTVRRSDQLFDDGRKAVYSVDVDRVAKIHRRPPAGYGSKLTGMIKSPLDAPEGATVAWPEDILRETDSSGPVVGSVMRRVEGYSVNTYYIPKNRVKYAPWFDYELLLTAAKNIANAAQAVHDQGYVIGSSLMNPIYLSLAMMRQQP